MKRTRLRPISKKRLDRYPERLAAMAIVRERDQVCQFWPRYDAWALTLPPEIHTLIQIRREFGAPVPDCRGHLNGHEPRKTAHYPEDYYDPTRIVLLCDGHNHWVEDYPNARKLLDL